MKKNILLPVLALALSLAGLHALSQQAPSSSAKKTDVTQLAFMQDRDKDDQRKPVRAERDQPQEIREAMQALRNAKNDLEHAGNEWGGHREKAIGHINAAMEELDKALDFAKTRRK